MFVDVGLFVMFCYIHCHSRLSYPYSLDTLLLRNTIYFSDDWVNGVTGLQITSTSVSSKLAASCGLTAAV